MTERVNFLEREILVITYLKMAYLMGALAAVFVLLFGLQTVRGELLERKLARLSHEVTELKNRRETLLATIEKSRGSAASADRMLRESLEAAPHWSEVLRELVRLMPSRLWLVSAKSYSKPDAAATRGLLLTGEAEDAEQISLFIKSVGSSPRFGQPLLTASREEKRGTGWIHTYTLDVSVRRGRESP